MAGGEYQRTCNKCQTTWSVPADHAEERPTRQSIAGDFTKMMGATYDDQLAMRAHFQQLGLAAKCPKCGATSFTQQKVAESAVPAVPGVPAPPPAVPAAPAPPWEWASNAAPPPPPATPPAAAAATTMASPGRTFVLNEKLISLTADMWIDDGQGNRAFEVDGKLVTLHGTHVLKDLNGRPLYEIQKPLAPHVHKTVEIKQNGQKVATVQAAIFHLGGDKFKILLAGGQEFTVHGNWTNREFQIKDQTGQQVINASRMWFTIHDAYGIQIAPGFDIPFGLAIVVALERIEVMEGHEESPTKSLLGDISPF